MRMPKLLILAALFAWSPLNADINALDLARYDGKVVLVDFWASWCVPCRRSFPWMNDMHREYADNGLVIIAVNLDRDTQDAAAFLARYPASFEITYDPAAELAKEYGIEVMPSSFIIGRDGALIEQHAGFKVKQQVDYEAVLRDALGLERQK